MLKAQMLICDFVLLNYRLTRKGFRQHGHLKNFSFTYLLLLNKDNWFKTFSKAHIAQNPMLAAVVVNKRKLLYVVKMLAV